MPTRCCKVATRDALQIARFPTAPMAATHLLRTRRAGHRQVSAPRKKSGARRRLELGVARHRRARQRRPRRVGVRGARDAALVHVRRAAAASNAASRTHHTTHPAPPYPARARAPASRGAARKRKGRCISTAHRRALSKGHQRHDLRSATSWAPSPTAHKPQIGGDTCTASWSPRLRRDLPTRHAGA